MARRLRGGVLPPPEPLARLATNSRFSFLELWSGEYAVRTAMIWLVWFFALLGFYGLTTWPGALLQAAGYSVTKSVSYTLLISLAGVPGFVAAAWLIESWGRKPTAMLTLIGSAIAAFAYGHAPSLTLLIVCGLSMQFFLFGMWSVLYAYTPEIYPTRARATGAGCASAVGRVGALIGPYVVGIVLPAIGQDGVFALGAGSFLQLPPLRSSVSKPREWSSKRFPDSCSEVLAPRLPRFGKGFDDEISCRGAEEATRGLNR